MLVCFFYAAEITNRSKKICSLPKILKLVQKQTSARIGPVSLPALSHNAKRPIHITQHITQPHECRAKVL